MRMMTSFLLIELLTKNRTWEFAEQMQEQFSCFYLFFSFDVFRSPCIKESSFCSFQNHYIIKCPETKIISEI